MTLLSKTVHASFDVAGLVTVMLSVGLHLPYLIGGAAGGAVNVLFLAKSGPREILGTITVGSLVANYTTESAVGYAGSLLAGHVDAYFICFAIGFAGMLLCKLGTAWLQTKLPAAAGSSPSGAKP